MYNTHTKNCGLMKTRNSELKTQVRRMLSYLAISSGHLGKESLVPVDSAAASDDGLTTRFRCGSKNHSTTIKFGTQHNQANTGYLKRTQPQKLDT
jgi:hypothetical protein